MQTELIVSRFRLQVVPGWYLCSVFLYLVQKETQCFYLHFSGLKIIEFKNCFSSGVLSSNKDLDCIVSSENWIPCTV